MELDLTGIHKLAAEQGIDPETWMMRWQRPCASPTSRPRTPPSTRRVELDERSGNFTVWAADEIPVEPTEDNPYPVPKLGEEYDDTPRDFGRLAAATARQVITQLFRRAEDEKVFGAFSGQKASSSPASSNRMLPTPPTCMSRWAMSKPFCLAVSRCPANVTATANASACTW